MWVRGVFFLSRRPNVSANCQLLAGVLFAHSAGRSFGRMSDPRKEYIVSCALGSLGALGSLASRRWEKPSHELELELRDSKELDTFLETTSVHVLQVTGAARNGGRRELAMSHSVSLGSDADVGVIFTKRSTDLITDGNVEEVVMMQTMHGSPLHSLQLTIQQLYAPLLLQDPHRASTLDAKTQSTLEALEKAVSSAVQSGGGSADDFSGIMSPHDECEHWRLSAGGMTGRSLSADEQRRAENVWNALQPVSEKLRTMNRLPVAEMAELIETVRTAPGSRVHLRTHGDTPPSSSGRRLFPVELTVKWPVHFHF